MLKIIPYCILYIETSNDIVISIRFPKIVLNNVLNNSGIKYKTNHIVINIVSNPIIFVLFSSFIKFFNWFIYY